MLSLKHQKGIIQLGIIGVLLLLGGLAVGTKLVTNSDLVFFNIAEKANNVDEENCHGCLGNDELRWDRKANDGEGECKKGPRLPVKAEEEVAEVHPRKLARVSVYQAKRPVRRKGL